MPRQEDALRQQKAVFCKKPDFHKKSLHFVRSDGIVYVITDIFTESKSGRRSTLSYCKGKERWWNDGKEGKL